MLQIDLDKLVTSLHEIFGGRIAPPAPPDAKFDQLLRGDEEFDEAFWRQRRKGVVFKTLLAIFLEAEREITELWATEQRTHLKLR